MAAIDKASRSNRKKQHRSKSSKPNKPSFGPNKQLNKKKKDNNNNNKKQRRKPKKGLNSKKSIEQIAVKDEKPTKITPFNPPVSPDDYCKFFLDQFEFANSIKLSSLELESIKDTYFIKLSEDVSQDASNLGTHLKNVFESKWKKVLCEPQLVEGQIDAGNPAVMVISASAIKSLEMLRGLRILTKECQAVKLFSKHIKVDEQVAMLKKRVNIASGTPSRIKKLAEMEALGLSRLKVIVLDMHTDVKGYSLFTLPQVRDEFWDLYKCYFHQRLLQGDLRVCLYGPISATTGRSKRKSEDE
ncbi:uncharacterized protein LOC141618797 [Silene latifolia]|uniref:uncharacterized protein LOC141618797 n=1 Tax=Silene latifolia TaxID=37657 RepID=UPI003D76EF75